MKTPKRHHELVCTSHDPCERVWDRPQEEVSSQRWKRKNRIAQYKCTIARQAEEIEHLRAALAIRTIHDINEHNKASLEYIQKHLSVDTFEPSIEREGDHNWMFKWKRPIPRWNNSIIDLHLPEDKQQ